MKAKNRRIAYLGATGGVVLAVLIGATVAANWQSNNLDLMLGRGKEHVTQTEGLDTNYIDFHCKNQDEALAYAQQKTRETAEEGMTFRQWINSDYNTSTMCLEGNIIRLRPGNSAYFTASADDVIVEGETYSWYK